MRRDMECLLVSFLGAIISLASLVFVSPAFALYTELHIIIAHEAARIAGVPSEVSLFLGDPADCLGSARDAICKGIYDEDAEIDPRMDPSNPFAWLGMFDSGTHLWDPAGGPAGGKLERVNGILVNRSSQNAYQRALSLYEKAKGSYPYDPEGAYYLFGRAVHLLADMATPAHVHLDPHVSDKDSTGDDSFEEVTGRRYVTQDRRLGIDLFESDFPVSVLDLAEPAELPDGGFHDEPELFPLFYDTATAAAAFDSDDADGLLHKGEKRGVSIPISRSDILQVYATATDAAVILGPDTYEVSTSRNKFVLLNNAIETMKSSQPPLDSIRFEFRDGVEVHSLSEFTKSDMQDSDVLEISRTLFPRALRNTAGLFRLFWQETHPGLGPGIPEIRLNNGSYITRVSRPQPVELSLDILPGEWEGEVCELYIWLDARLPDGRFRAYSDGNWVFFEGLDEVRPLLPSILLGEVRGLSWVIASSTEGFPDLDFALNICLDRSLDGHLTPQESVCGAALFAVGP